MLGRLKRLRYRGQVLDHLHALLLAYPRGRQLTTDYPRLRAAIDAELAAGASPAGASLHLAVTVLRDLLGQLAPAERAAALSQIGGLGWEELRGLAGRRLARRAAERRDPVRFATEIVGVAIFIARGMTEDGTFHRPEYEVFLNEIDLALRPRAAGTAEEMPQMSLTATFRLPHRRAGATLGTKPPTGS